MKRIATMRRRMRASLRAMSPAVLRSAVAVCALLLLQALLFSPSWRAFFCGDSVFYLSRVVEQAQLRYLFTHCDIQGAYRPLTYLVFSWLFYPRFGLYPFGYHLATLSMHLLGCVLVYRLFRKTLPAAAALAGLFFFGVHSVNFYTTYDVTFLPDLMALACWVGALLCYTRYLRARSRFAYAAALTCFLAGLLSKETIVVLPASLVVWAWLLWRRESPGSAGEDARVLTLHSFWQSLYPALPFFLVDALYLAWTEHIKYGLLYPGGVYGFTLRGADLLRKADYLVWLLNLPTGLDRSGWPAFVAGALMLPVILWGCWLLARAWRAHKLELAACLLWAAAALAPLICVTQAPMKHNLYVPLAACGLALGIAVEAGLKSRIADCGPEQSAIRNPKSTIATAGVGLAVVLSVAIQVRLDLRYSWVGEGSRITQASLEAVRRARPVLPRSALLYVLPSQVRGNAAWYFDSGGLFRVFYRDPSLRMAFADAGQTLPPDFASRNDVVVFRFSDDRLYDVTVEYAAERSSNASYRLIEQFRPEAVTSKYQWRPVDLPPNGPVYTGVVARGDVSRQALVMLPGTSVRLPVPPIPAGSVLSIGVTPAGARSGGTQGKIEFEYEGNRELVALRTLDSHDYKDDWSDSHVSLSRWAGRSGYLVLSSVEDPGADWLAWSRLRLEDAERARSTKLRLAGPRPHHRLLDQFRPERVEMDRNEPYADYSRFETPTGAPAFFFFVRPATLGRLALVTLAGARVSFPLRKLYPDSVLLVSLAPALRLGDGTEARIFFAQAGSRQLLLSKRVLPQQRDWSDFSIALGAFAGRDGNLVLECGSGPAHDNTADWLAWGRLRIERQVPQGRWIGNRSGGLLPGKNANPPPSPSSRIPVNSKEDK